MGLNPYVFIVGCPRSGTTLVRRIVDAHPQIAITRAETHWIPELFRRSVGVTRDGHVTRELLETLSTHPTFVKLRIDPRSLEGLADERAKRSYAEFVTGIFDAYGRQEGKRLAGDKTPGYVRSIPTLHGLWPTARFVHVVRDGRDVGLSAVNWTRKAESFARRYPTWAEDPVATAAFWWRWHVSIGRREGARLGPGLYHELRYEDLVRDPAAACRRLCAFLELDYDDAMVRFHEGRQQRPDRDAKHAWLPITAGLRDWRTDMPREDLERFEAAAGDLLDELGYPRAIARLDPRRLADAERIGARFARKAPSADRPLPDGW
jgi:hypothetical protein